LIKKYVDLLITRLHENSNKGPQDMVAWFDFVSFDIIGDLTLGESFDCLQQSGYYYWVSFLFNSFKFAAFLTAARRFALVSNLLVRLIPKSLLQDRLRHTAFTKETVEKHMLMGTDRHDFMSNVLGHNDKEVWTSLARE